MGAHALRAVREGVRSYNADFRTRGLVAIGMGVATSGVVFVGVYVAVFVLTFRLNAQTFWIALAVFGVFFVVAWWTAARGGYVESRDPYSAEEDASFRSISYVATGTIINPKSFAEGSTTLVMFGPQAIIEGWGLLRSVLTASDATIAAAGELLSRLLLGRPIALASVESKPAAMLLLRTGLAKFEGKGSVSLVATVKGREAVGEKA